MDNEFNFIDHLNDQYEFSQKAFGPKKRTDGVIKHIKKELKEIKKDPDDLEEWIDLILLSCDGPMRRGFTAEEIALGLRDKLEKNKQRNWPDWRLFSEHEAIEHIRD